MSEIFSPNLTFTEGFILGQASFLIILLLFIRYVVFSPSEQIDHEGWRKRRAERADLLSNHTPPPLSILLSKTSYDMSIHPAESSDWVNVLLAQILQGYRNDLLSEGGEEGARQRVEGWLNPKGENLSWLDPIDVTSLSLGTSYPLLSNARIRPADGQGRLRAEIDVDYLDSLSMTLSTAVLINFPKPRFAVLPVTLGVELVSIGGTMSVQLHEPIEDRQHIHANLLPDFHLNLKVTSLLGSRAKLQDIPKLEQLIVSRLRNLIQDRFVHPNHISLALPRILSPSVSSTPILEGLGEGAVDAMKDAVSDGVKRMVEDFMGENSVEGALNGQGEGQWLDEDYPSTPLVQPPGTFPTLSASSPQSFRQSLPPSRPQSTTQGQPQLLYRRPLIHPTQSYPHYNTYTLDPQIPHSVSYRHPPREPHVHNPPQTPVPQRPSHGQGRMSTASSLTPSQSQSQFRFRGQFASSVNPGQVGASR
ncbi:mitochondrial outer membrane protein [Cryptococcus neoformans C23]|uniref:Maintenance of mitochondrial morphology protein 1 n=1 Tax=Cryptococcus neoformans (strain H99 / ATCC 208821 / CBS 10515 / FGSC 9487) TaxID=235443 RepID=J9W1V9_CRYN9|nr:mitochondrial outer membrane protein [Cryptococcus neoformans var. grubii H99]AUB29210.1 mitochondrial outer membrane protein [Cryptococcus neoformans var. grubii]OWZ37959.1 mitochondrial outer membrane protein [Cryptococcus neoformans var. grubii C23]OWZ49702.1 mitochondrial outer membrane protein [Cryptococcus neoformans var. grubii 125.91]OXC80836.1 mitochondrial outer membrane protein [Cryptococcus neoformans var. grubii AD1-7a]OXG32484.1 mitochondrial outer membrane protein [Cryptococc|eukprot:XP_012053845.1 mitochondrial outer membrane protein [Cryptococcus neoformans var. grubii H99]